MDHSKRQVLPANAAVKGPRFSTSKHWEISSVAREVLDSFDLPLRSRVVDAPCESIVMEGAEIRRTMRTGSHAVRQTFTAPLELDTTPAPLAFEVVADTTLRDAAGQALAALNNRPHARRAARPERATAAHWATRTIWVWTLLIGSALIAATWLCLAFR